MSRYWHAQRGPSPVTSDVPALILVSAVAGHPRLRAGTNCWWFSAFLGAAGRSSYPDGTINMAAVPAVPESRTFRAARRAAAHLRWLWIVLAIGS